MGSLIKEKTQNRKLFRELFFNSQKSLLDRFNGVKKNFSCSKCAKCCAQKYLEVSPQELEKLAEQEEVWANFLEFFEPNDVEDDYSKRVRAKVTNDVWFYSCKYVKDGQCQYDGAKQIFCQDCGVNIEKVLHQDCSFIEWQKLVLQIIEDDIFKDILMKYKQMEAYKEESFKCNCTGTCCKFACSEFSYDELLEKAKNGDNFATQFTSVFVPYENQEKAKEIYPEYVEMLEQKLGKDEKVYFYYCPHLDENNLCTQYDKRPDVCREFPNNPLSILPEWCGYYQWKEEVEVLAMTLHALLSISEFYKERLENVI